MQNEIKSYAYFVKMYEEALHNETKKEKKLRDEILKAEKELSKVNDSSM
jgi:hypothetical protein